MPSIHRRFRSPFWYGAYTDTLGRRCKKSTRETERVRAVAVVEKWQREADTLASAATTESPVPTAKTPELMERFITLSQRAVAGSLTVGDAEGLMPAVPRGCWNR